MCRHANRQEVELGGVTSWLLPGSLAHPKPPDWLPAEERNLVKDTETQQQIKSRPVGGLRSSDDVMEVVKNQKESHLRAEPRTFQQLLTEEKKPRKS